jgi:iron complex transport system substrate-binding protein
MIKRILALVFSVLLGVMLLAGCGQDQAQQTQTADKTAETAENQAEETQGEDYMVTDLLERDVTIPADAQTFVAIGPGCLRLYCYVADTSKLVGIEQIEQTSISSRPYVCANEQLLELEVIGAGGPANAPDAEKLLVADPDVIFTLYTSDAATVNELEEKTGIPVVALSYGANEMFDPAIDQSLELIGQITGNEERAAEVIGYFEELRADLELRVQDVAEDNRPLAYMGGMGMRGAHGIESTTGNFSIFNAINARNAVDEAGISEYIMLDKEKLLEIDPEYIFIDGTGLSLVYEDYAENAEFYNGLQAFKNNNVYMHMPYNYYYTNLGVAIADSYYIGSILYPEEFDDVDPGAKLDEIITTLLGAGVYEKMAETYYGGYQNLTFE